MKKTITVGRGNKKRVLGTVTRLSRTALRAEDRSGCARTCRTRKEAANWLAWRAFISDITALEDVVLNQIRRGARDPSVRS